MFFDKKNEKGEYIFDILFGKNNKSDYIYTLAEAHAIDLIAKTISKCEIQVFGRNNETKKIEEKKNEIYWSLNLQPNYHENGTRFLYKLVTKLLTKKTALVLINKGPNGNNLFYVADDFIMNDSILYGKVFSNVIITDDEGNTIPMIKKYNIENSIYYSIKNTGLQTASENFKNNMSKILDVTSKSFIKNNISKWRLKFPGGQPTIMDIETKQPISYDKYKAKITEGLMSEEEAIVLLSEAFDLINLNEKTNNKNLDDFEKAVLRTGNTVAQNWNIPLDIFYGSKTEKSTGTNDFITLAVDPYFTLLEDGLNIGIVGKEDYLKGEYVAFNKFNICHKDIIESANGIDKLTADGFSRNEINKLLGLPRIDEPWADEHNLTKNYANVKGGANKNGE